MRTDIAVVGAGPAGIAAATKAEASGARVLVLDDNSGPGGQIWRGSDRRLPSGVFDCRVVSADANPLKLVVEGTEPWEVRPRKLIIATGAREIFLPFPGWTLPGVFGVGGLQGMAKSGLPIAGKKIVVAGSGPLLLAVAAHLRSHGAQIKLIAEQAPRANLIRFASRLISEPGKLAQAIALQSRLLGVPYLQDCWIEEALGDGKLHSVRLRRGQRTWTENCDYAAVAFGLCPNTELAALLGCRLTGTAVVDQFQSTSVENVYSAGGVGGVDLSIVEGEIAGYAAAGQIDKARKLFARRMRAQTFASALDSTFEVRDELKRLPRPDTIVCRCEDVTFSRLQQVASFREAKLHARCGMGPCQGRVCGPAADFLFGWRTESIRPPVFPARLGTLAVCSGKE